MKIEKEEKNGVVIYRCEGHLDANTAVKMEEALRVMIDAGKKKLVIDFSKIDYLSSAGMRLLLSVTKRLHAAGGKLVLISLQDNVMEIIRMAGFESILNLYISEEEALKAI
ncbi:MAG: hypothetical protein A3F09_03210 [Chlamydiae bacterium RIFCSPHIGHO2_12_FULL_49_11]|nr:MAG: hypothetical protein A3F09_03210 [Chlamydiae bacterium RIFCSPHIGHO2_12_FULL_49_11]